MSKTVVPTPPLKVIIAEENEDRLEKVVLSEMAWDENTIMGNVSDKQTGKPIEGACIKICDNDYNPIVFNFTDVDGNFTMQGKLASCIRVLAAKKGYITFSSDSVPSVGLERKALNIELVPASNGGIVFLGNVRDAYQKPLGGIKITVYKANSLNPYDFTFTNQEGLYAFDNIDPGSYRVTVQSQDFTEKTLTFEAGREQSIVTLETVYLKRKSLKGTLHGVITDSNGLPVNNALVVLFNANNIPVQITHTNDKGVYLFYKLDQGSYMIMAK